MLFSAGIAALVALLSLLFFTLASASPFASPAQIFGLEERQDDITIGNVATEDELTDQIAGDGTGAMRSEQIEISNSGANPLKPPMLDLFISPTRPRLPSTRST